MFNQISDAIDELHTSKLYRRLKIQCSKSQRYQCGKDIRPWNRGADYIRECGKDEYICSGKQRASISQLRPQISQNYNLKIITIESQLKQLATEAH